MCLNESRSCLVCATPPFVFVWRASMGRPLGCLLRLTARAAGLPQDLGVAGCHRSHCRGISMVVVAFAVKPSKHSLMTLRLHMASHRGFQALSTSLVPKFERVRGDRPTLRVAWTPHTHPPPCQLSPAEQRRAAQARACAWARAIFQQTIPWIASGTPQRPCAGTPTGHPD